MDIGPVINELDNRYSRNEAAIIGRVLRAYNGAIPDKQLIDEAALALAIHRRINPGT